MTGKKLIRYKRGKKITRFVVKDQKRGPERL